MRVVEYLLHTLEKNKVEVISEIGTTEIRSCARASTEKNPLRGWRSRRLRQCHGRWLRPGEAQARRSSICRGAGLGNGRAPYTAGIAGTPLLVLIGGQDRRFLHTQPILWGPVEQMARSVCQEVLQSRLALRCAPNIRRALRAVLTPPFGPVALLCPPDLLDSEIHTEATAVRAPALPGFDDETAQEYAAFLAAAKRPAIIASEDVHWSGAAKPLETLAAAYAAPVYAAPYTGMLPISASSPWYAGYLPPSLKQIAERLEDRDALLFVGGAAFARRSTAKARCRGAQRGSATDSHVQPPDEELALACMADLARALTAIVAKTPAKRAPARSAPARAQLELPPAKSGALHPTRPSPLCSSASATPSGSTSRDCRLRTCGSG